MLNGQLTLEIAIIGAILSAALYLFVCKFMDYSPRRELRALRKIGPALLYAVKLVVEVFKANFAVMKILLSPKRKIEPVLFYFRPPLKTDAARSILANSITLTPGTITVNLEDGNFCVHCLDRQMSEGLDDWSLLRFLEKQERA